MASKARLPVLDHIDVPEDVRRAWQESVDLLSEMLRAASVLITRFHNRGMEIIHSTTGGGHDSALSTQDLMTHEVLCEKVLRNRKPLHVPNILKDPSWNRNPDAPQVIISYLCLPLFWPKGEPFGVLSVLDTKETFHTLQSMRLLGKFTTFFMSDIQGMYLSHELEKATRATLKLKKKMGLFLGIAAHDLKGSLNVLMSCSTMLLEKFDVKTRKERTYLNLIHKSGIAMQNLLDELMEISRIESMRVPMSVHEVDLTRIVRDSVQIHQPLAEAKGIQINLLTAGNPLMMTIDPAKIDQVLGNLISNAVKFSKRYSTITVSIDNKAEEVVISVQDQGPGIPMEEQYNLFRPFQTTSIQALDGEASTGLGLYIARRIVEEHGGRIWVESETGSGSMFCFSLRYAHAPEENHEPVRHHTPAKQRIVLKESPPQ